MGSLMSGWDLPVSTPESVEYKRNRSFTKGEIEAFWRSKKKIEEEHLKAILAPSADGTTQEGTSQDHTIEKFRRSNSLPPADKKSSSMDTETSLEDLIKKNGWWTRSNSAFLNELPVIERSYNTYAAQFHVANISNSKPDGGISAN